MSADITSPILGACMQCGGRFDQVSWDARHSIDEPSRYHPDTYPCDADPGDYHPDT